MSKPSSGSGMVVIALIELGEIASGQVFEESPTRPWPHRRLAAVAVALGLALVSLGGSAPAARPLQMVLLNASADSSVVAAADRLVVVDRGSTGGGQSPDRYVTSYRLMDLHRLWQIKVPVRGEGVTPLVSADTVVLSRSDYPTAWDRLADSRPDTAAVDALSGALLWQREGFAEAWTSAGHMLMSLHSGAPSAPGEQDNDGQLLRVVSARTGAAVWSMQMPPGSIRTYRFEDDRLTLLALILPGGRAELRDPNTGQVLGSGQIDPPSSNFFTTPSAEIVGDLLLIHERAALAAYSLNRLYLRWRMPAPRGSSQRPSACGTALCLQDPLDGLRYVDPQTGRVRWSDPRWTNLLAATESALLVGDYDARRDGLRVVDIDSATGQVRQDFGTWAGIDSNSRDESVIGYQFELTRALVARVEPGRGPRILGVVHDMRRSCQVREPMLLCRRADNTLGVWRLPD